MAENYTQRQVDRTARLDLKTNQHFKAQLEEAAALSGVNLTAFILSAAAEKVREVSHRSFCEQSTLVLVSCVKVLQKNAPTKRLSMIKICASLAFVNFCAGIITNILVTNFKLFK